MKELLLPSIQLFGGLILLIAASWYFIQGSVHLGLRFGIRPYVLGATLLALGDCLPELSLSLNATSEGFATLALAGIVGSNAVNLLLLLGIASVYKPLEPPSWPQVRFLLFSLLAILGITLPLGLDWTDGAISLSQIGVGDGIVLLSLLAVFLAVYLYLQGRGPVATYEQRRALPLWKIVLCVVVGGVGIYWSGHWAIAGTVAYMRHFGVAQEVLGLFPVALMVSIPELLMLVDTARCVDRGDMIPAVLLSSIFNLLLVLGIASLSMPLPLYEGFILHWGLLGAGLVVLIFALYVGRAPRSISRVEGVILLLCYLAFAIYVWMRSGEVVRVTF